MGQVLTAGAAYSVRMWMNEGESSTVSPLRAGDGEGIKRLMGLRERRAMLTITWE
jgi:hypothetical protein